MFFAKKKESGDREEEKERRFQSVLVAGDKQASVWLEEGIRCKKRKNYQEALRLFKLASDKKDPEATYRLARMHAQGLGVKQDLKEEKRLLELIKNAAETGESVAQFVLGIMYANGHGVIWNDIEPVRWYRLSAEQGNEKAQCNLGFMYQNARGVERKDYVEAIKWYKLSAKLGNGIAQLNQGLIYLEDAYTPLHPKGIKLLRLSAEQGNAEAQFELGVYCFTTGTYGIEQDIQEGLRLFQSSSEQGHAEAQCILGEMHLKNDFGIKQDYQEAKRLLQLSAEQGHAGGQYTLGRMYRYGEITNEDEDFSYYKEAAKWYKLSAEQGHAGGQCGLGELYSSPDTFDFCKCSDTKTIQEYKKEAVKLLRLSVEGGNAYACILLGNMYEGGEYYHEYNQLFKINYQEAVKLYKLALKRGNTNAYESLAHMHYWGKGIPQSYQKVIELSRLMGSAGYTLKRLADGGNIDAQFAAGELYLAEGLKRNSESEWYIENAIGYFFKAAKQNHEKALGKLEELIKQSDASINSVIGQLFYKAVAENNRSLLLQACTLVPDSIIDTPNPADGDTALHLAIKQDKIALAKVLILHGANVSTRNDALQTPQEILIDKIDKGEEYFSDAGKKKLLALTLCVKRINLPNSKFNDASSRCIVKERDAIAVSNNLLSPGASSVISRNIISSKPCYKLDKKSHKATFKEMETSPHLQPLLKLVAFAVEGMHKLAVSRRENKRLKIVLGSYKNNEETTEKVTLGTCTNAYGVYYHDNTIYLGGKRSADSQRSKILMRGTLIHEITHFVAHEVFQNGAAPYAKDDKKSAELFDRICRRIHREFVKDQPAVPEIISGVFALYDRADWHAELIVRVPQMIAMGMLADVEKFCPDLLEYYNNHFLVACQAHLVQSHCANNVFMDSTIKQKQERKLAAGQEATFAHFSVVEDLDTDSENEDEKILTFAKSPAPVFQYEIGQAIVESDFVAQNPYELTVRQGDVVSVIDRDDAWWVCGLNGWQGHIPSQCLRVISSRAASSSYGSKSPSFQPFSSGSSLSLSSVPTTSHSGGSPSPSLFNTTRSSSVSANRFSNSSSLFSFVPESYTAEFLTSDIPSTSDDQSFSHSHVLASTLQFTAWEKEKGEEEERSDDEKVVELNPPGRG